MLVADPLAKPDHAVPLSPTGRVNVDESTAETIADWHYWVAQGYCLLIYAYPSKARDCF